MTWCTARELAGLPGMPGTERRTRDKLAAMHVPARPRPGRGGGLEYKVDDLPQETRVALAARQIEQAGTALPAVAAPEPIPQRAVSVASGNEAMPALPQRRLPSQADKEVADARTALVNMVHELMPVHGIKRSCALLALQLASGQATPQLQAMARAANQKARAAQVGARTLERWVAQHRQNAWWGLLPAPAAPASQARLADDVAAVLGRYHSRDARFRNLSNAAKDVTRSLGRPFDDWRALYGRARRALQKVDNVTLIKARHSGSARAARLPFKRRDTSMLRPLDVWLIDGHTFKAKVRHPDHGAPFAPERTIVMDAATRLICGWSVALAENVFAVGDALRHAIGQYGVPAIVYTDNGAGETARAMDCPIDGFMTRLGIEHRTGIPGHPQGHGLIERGWRTHAINCARQFGSYQGSDADGGTYRHAAAEIAKEQRAIKRAGQQGSVVIRLTPKLPSWEQFINAVDAMVADYNGTHRHRSLPKGEDGKHMTPAQAWAAKLDVALQHRPGDLELRALFMPSALRVAQRGQVTLFNQQYQAPELMAIHVDGHRVSVRYDIHDPSTVQIYTLDGEFVCEAKWNANRIDYFPQAAIEIAREKRVRAAVKRRQLQIETALRELQAPVQAETLVSPLLPQALAEVPVMRVVDVQTAPEPATTTAGRPFFDTASERYEWLMRHRTNWQDADISWLEQYVGSDDYDSLRDYYTGRGLAWTAGDGNHAFKDAQTPVAASA